MDFLKKHRITLVSVMACSSLFFTMPTLAGAFQLWEQSAAGLGDYHAGGAAEANDASTVFYNPAGMSRIKHQQISFGGVLIDLKAGFQGSTYSYPASPSTFYGATTFPEPGDTANAVPNFHYVLPINDRWAVGVDETTPFGASTDYVDINPNVDYVNYLATKTQLETVNLNPGVSYAINRYLSVGVGFDAMYGQADYDANFAAPITNNLSGWGYGYNAGVLFQLTQQTRFGLSYRSAITIPAKGPSQFYGGIDEVTNTTANTNFPLPATTTFSFYQDVTHDFTLMASAFYTQWSCFKTLVIENMAQNNGSTGNIAINENYRNTWNLALGAMYRFDRHFSLEAGVGHDQTPTSLPYRDIRLPDMSHYVTALGFNVSPTSTVHFSIGWAHLFLGNTPVDNSESYNAAQSTISGYDYTVGIGQVKTAANVYGIQLTFDV